MEKVILWFGNLDKGDVHLVGGKGANLGELFSYFPVPNGFCVTVQNYKRFLEETGIGSDIHELLDSLDVENQDNLEKVSGKIRDTIVRQKIPADIEKEILKNYHRLKNNKVAVRSSATTEDLAGASFAGQHDTYLNVKGPQALIKSVKKCWASLFTERVLCYRKNNKLSHKNTLMSVVVQEMVDAEYAGVIFTVDPVNKKEILIEVVKGLGEQLVSGNVTPNTYFMNKKTYKIENKAEYFYFDKKNLKAVSEIGERIEKHYRCPQDIEFCIDKKGKLFIVQSRPITTLLKR